MAVSKCFYTKDQVLRMMSTWGCTEPLPKKGKQVVVCWAKPMEPNTAVITLSEHKSDDGKRLYLVVMGVADEVLRPNAVGSPDGLSDGRAAHIAWESVRGDENECDAEQRISDDVKAAGADMDVWWRGWFERSDEWRDEIGFDG